MTEKTILSIGFIPESLDLSMIECGNSPKCNEHTIVIEDEKALVIETNETFSASGAEFWEEGSNFYKNLSKLIGVISSGAITVSPSVLKTAWAVIQDEEKAPSGMIYLDECEGEFRCNHFKDNAHFYIRHQTEEDEEYYNDKVVVIDSARF